MKKRNVKRDQLHFKEIARQVPHFVFWRRHLLSDESDVVTHKEVMTFNRLGINPEMVEYALNKASVRFQCVTVSYCEDPWGKVYRLLGYATTTEPIRMVDEDVSPVIFASRRDAESEANLKHIRGHAMVLMPLIDKGPLVYDVVVRLRDKLSLDDRDLKALYECVNAPVRHYDVTRVGRDDLDNEIAALLS